MIVWASPAWSEGKSAMEMLQALRLRSADVPALWLLPVFLIGIVIAFVWGRRREARRHLPIPTMPPARPLPPPRQVTTQDLHPDEPVQMGVQTSAGPVDFQSRVVTNDAEGLRVRLPAVVAKGVGLKPGDEVEIVFRGEGGILHGGLRVLEVSTDPFPMALLAHSVDLLGRERQLAGISRVRVNVPARIVAVRRAHVSRGEAVDALAGVRATLVDIGTRDVSLDVPGEVAPGDFLTFDISVADKAAGKLDLRKVLARVTEAGPLAGPTPAMWVRASLLGLSEASRTRLNRFVVLSQVQPGR